MERKIEMIIKAKWSVLHSCCSIRHTHTHSAYTVRASDTCTYAVTPKFRLKCRGEPVYQIKVEEGLGLQFATSSSNLTSS